jgi:hypothetical protein
MPEKFPYGIGEITPYPKYVVPKFDGKTFSDIDVSFFLPDDFRLDRGSFLFSPDPISATANPVFLTAVCISDPILVRYYLNFPVIVRAKDPLTGHVFQFSDQIFIKNNAPGDWSDEEIYEQEIQNLVCSNAYCSADIQVSSLGGDPVEGAAVSFMGCSLGLTDSLGRVQSSAPCGSGSLIVTKEGYDYYFERQNYTDINGKHITLPRKMTITVKFYEVNLQDSGFDYTIDRINPLPAGRNVTLSMKSASGSAYTWYFGKPAGILKVPAGTYSVLGSYTDNFQTSYGQFLTIATINENVDELHIYLPNNLQFSTLTDTDEILNKTFLLTNIMELCGISPVSANPADDSSLPCIKQYNEV